ncbi:MAG: YbbR-like domain-containing protein [Muribaculaceae bacterium]|nr:YbbR-like domain-containing protein [Muribaculaceae bacterium]
MDDVGKKIENIRSDWRRFKTSSQFHNVLMFLVFVAIATVFWFIIALNDNITETFRVRLNIVGVPDSVTFITDPPADLHVTVRDKGTNILRSGVIKNPTVDVSFRDYARDGVFRLSAADLAAELKSDLGGAATITSASIDSLRLYYTLSPGKRVPVIVQADVSAASGYIIPGAPAPLTRQVRVYSYKDEIDTVNAVRTQRLVRNGLSQTSVFDVKLVPVPHVKIVPAQVQVRVPVEPLVHKEAFVNVEVENLPQGESLLLFPNKVPVSFYVPMSHFNDEYFPMRVVADYNETHATPGSRISVHVSDHAGILVNVELKTDSVEYTLVKH